jgi:RNA polymerase sigma-70 factor, ECF subfamily
VRAVDHDEKLHPVKVTDVGSNLSCISPCSIEKESSSTGKIVTSVRVKRPLFKWKPIVEFKLPMIITLPRKMAGSISAERLAEIFDTYYEPIYRYAYIHLRDHDAAEDIAAVVFHKLLDSVQKGHMPVTPRAWLYQVARNLIIDHARRQRHHDHAPLTDTLAVPANVESTVEALLRAERAHEAILRLNERQRNVIILRFLQGLDVSEVAVILNGSVGAIKTLQHRALENLRQLLGNES